MLPITAITLLLAALSVKPPLTIESLEEVSDQFPGAPKIQSFAFGQSHGRWLFIGGRIAGYHSVGGGMAEFLRTDANQEVWVVDTTVRPAKTFHVPLEQLPASLAPLKDQWSAAAHFYYQDGDALYIGGGYGVDHEGNSRTYPLLSRIDLPRLIDGVIAGKLPEESIVFTETPLAKAAGGELTKLNDGFFYLVMGHTFDGGYTAFEGSGEQNDTHASQTYLNEIRKLKIVGGPHHGLTVTLADKFSDATEFHRRDLNVAHVMSPKGLGLAAYGGVFTADSQLGYSKPVYMFSGSTPVVDSSFDQKMNAYTCPMLLVYDKSAQTMYTTFFGGISQYSWDASKNQFIENPRLGGKTERTYMDGLQWSDQISTLRKVMAPGNESTTESVQSLPLPNFLGTNGVFIPAPEIPRAEPGTDVLDFAALQAPRTFVGYIYGGILASPYQFPYLKTATPYRPGTVPTKPSDKILKVYVHAE